MKIPVWRLRVSSAVPPLHGMDRDNFTALQNTQ
jgi:hypothetical protein